MLKVQNITKSYNSLVILNDISFSVNKGEVAGFLGINGAGKTTTLNIISGYIEADSGDVLIDNEKINLNAKSKIGYLPDSAPIYSQMRVREYLNFILDIKKVDNAQRPKLIEEAITKCLLDKVVNKLCGSLSRGYKQRLGIAQAIIHNPDLIILDEPTTALDPEQIEKIRLLIKSLETEHAVILSTHNLDDVLTSCNKIIMLHEGEVTFEDNIKNIEDRDLIKKTFLKKLTKS